MNKSAWISVRLGEVAEIVMGQAPPGDIVSDEGPGTPFLQGNAEFGIVHPTSKLFCRRPPKVCAPEDTLISVRAPVGALNIADHEYAIGRGLAAIRFRKINTAYGRHCLRSAIGQLQTVAQGTTFAAVGSRELANMALEIPTESSEQQRISEILDSAEEQIRAAEAVLRKLTSLKSGVIRTAFDGMPQGRERSTVGALFSIKSGITLGPHRLPGENASKYLRVANVQRALIDLSDVALIQASATEKAELQLAIGDLLVVEGHANPEEIGRCALVDSNAAGLLYQNHLFRLRSAKVDPEFAELWLNSDETRAYWQRKTATSSGLYTINSRMLRELPFPAVAPEDQADVVNAQRLVADTVKVLHDEVNKLRLIKLSLMDELLTGRMPTLYPGMQFTVGRRRRGGPLRNVRLRLYRRKRNMLLDERSLG